MTEFIHLNPRDNVLVAACDLPQGHQVQSNGHAVRLAGPVRMGHKIALVSIPARQPVLKYGHPIGIASQPIGEGDWVHSHNLSSGDLSQDYASATDIPPDPAPLEGYAFQGYRRRDGRAGTRNYVAIISSVNCSASVSKYIAERFDRTLLDSFPNIDGILPLTHAGGCAMRWQGEHHELLNRVLGGMARHPNIGAYLLVGLGCEQGSLGYLVESQNLVQIDGTVEAARRPHVLSIQDCGGTVKTVEAGIRALSDLLPQANDVKREPIPARELVLATQCGGSDGNSGITANPAVGTASDMLVAAGGTTILAETPEIYGAEQLLTRRARTSQIADKLIDRIAWWKEYAAAHNSELDSNPSVGNKEGGLTTIYEKSLGAVAKGGSTALCEVYQYAEPVTAKGLVVMDTPGYDPVSITGMVAGGANVVVFTTGRGSCYGCKPAPSIKVASNTRMYEWMRDDMDVNGGAVLEGETVAQVGRQIFQEILDVASGKPTKSEIHGIGESEFVPWQIGPTL